MTQLQKLRKFVVYSPVTFRWIVRSTAFRLYQRRKLRSWQLRGRMTPGPPVFKQSVVRAYAKRFDIRTLVETGTYLGQMIAAVRDDFDRIVTIELDDHLYHRATRVFGGDAKVELHRGDSATVLASMLPTLTHPTIFWLDAHYSGPGTALGSLETPIVKELELVLANEHTRVVLIDDAREFGRAPHYPTVDEVTRMVKARHPTWAVEVRDDIIRAHIT